MVAVVWGSMRVSVGGKKEPIMREPGLYSSAVLPPTAQSAMPMRVVGTCTRRTTSR